MADRLVNMVYFTQEDFCGDDGSILFFWNHRIIGFWDNPCIF